MVVLLVIAIASFSSPRLKSDDIHQGSVLGALLFLHPLQWQCHPLLQFQPSSLHKYICLIKD